MGVHQIEGAHVGGPVTRQPGHRRVGGELEMPAHLWRDTLGWSSGSPSTAWLPIASARGRAPRGPGLRRGGTSTVRMARSSWSPGAATPVGGSLRCRLRSARSRRLRRSAVKSTIAGQGNALTLDAPDRASAGVVTDGRRQGGIATHRPRYGRACSIGGCAAHGRGFARPGVRRRFGDSAGFAPGARRRLASDCRYDLTR